MASPLKRFSGAANSIPFPRFSLSFSSQLAIFPKENPVFQLKTGFIHSLTDLSRELSSAIARIRLGESRKHSLWKDWAIEENQRCTESNKK